MIDLNTTYLVIMWVCVAMWGFIFVFGAGNERAMKPFFVSLAVWVSFLVGKGGMKVVGYHLPTIAIMGNSVGVSEGVNFMLSVIPGVVIMSIALLAFNLWRSKYDAPIEQKDEKG